MPSQNLRLAFRTLWKDRFFSVLNIIGLSTGLACTFFILLWVQEEKTTGRFGKDDDRRYQVLMNVTAPDGIHTGHQTPGLLAQTLQSEIPEIEHAVATIYPGGLTSEKGYFRYNGKATEARALFAGDQLLDVFPYHLLSGNRQKLFPTSQSMLITRSFAKKIFGAETVAPGRMLEWNQFGNSGLYSIAGVLDDLPQAAIDRFDVVFPYALFLQKNPKLNNWNNNDPCTFLLLNKGTDPIAVNKKLTAFIQAKKGKTTSGLLLQPYGDIYLYNNYKNGAVDGGRVSYVKTFTAIAVIILLIACINFVNLSTARASGRMKGTLLRKVMGAKRLSLIVQSLREAMLLSFGATALALMIVVFLLPQFNLITGKNIIVQATLWQLSGIFGITIIVGLLAGIYPACYLSGFRLPAMFRQKIQRSKEETVFRKALVVFQFAISVILLTGVLVVHQQMQLIQNKNLGYSRNNVIYFDFSGWVSDQQSDYQAGGKFESDLHSFLAEVRQLPHVLQAANFRHSIINRQGGTSDVTWPGKPPNASINFTDIAAGYGFIETLDIQMVSGRPFSEKFGDNKSSVILNEAAVAAMQLPDPVGKVIRVWGEDKTIIGVTKNFNFESLYEPLKPCFFDFTFSNRASKVMVRTEPGTTHETIEKLSVLYQSFQPGIPFTYYFLEDEYAALYASEYRVADLSGYFAILAVIISCLGLFGLVAYTIVRKQKEIGIRKVIGASVLSILVLLSKNLLQLVVLAVAIGLPVSWWIAQRWLDNFEYRIVAGPLLFGASAAIVLIITAITISVHTVRAALINPVKVLHND
ncbi:ABC transporter permease [Flavihumibacter petaseus]|uniref:Putative ABC transporter permease protein n=1 Tax=Flavihumibacter petaseus NBRC 106054 TaxID=1220578 RepID=A0A0E9MUM1_9BACT|nr:ABC transporter permease [Flavihumibacter petaseus]GAO41274.1 putative ABC transporter permease protein [Flavihumibacter petaseus NBRC 106054]